MKERLLGFVFLGALLAAALSFAIDKIHVWLFPNALWFETTWYLPFLAFPALCLLALAFSLGFFRPKGPRWADAAALLVTALLIYLTLGAAFSCWNYCF